MARFILTQTIVIPAGTEMKLDDRLGDGGVSAQFDDAARAQLFLSRAAALAEGMIVARPALAIVANYQ